MIVEAGEVRSRRVRAAAVDLLAAIEAGAWSDRALASRERAFSHPADRALIHSLTLTALRWQGALDERLAPLVRAPGLMALEPRVRAALRCGAAEAFVLDHPGPVAVDGAVHAVREVGVPAARGLVNAVLRRLVAEGGTLDAAATIPQWIRERWERHFGLPAARALVDAANRPARPFAVARPDRGGRKELEQTLAGAGVATEPASRHPDGLVVLRGAPQTTAAFGRGDFLLLDEAAALVALLATPTDERLIADLAAAPGGKAALIAQRAPGRLIALECVGSRLTRLAETIERATPVGRATAVRGDATCPPLEREGFGTVLLDAPCSGTGTLRRRPEKRHRLAAADVAACAARQARMLDAAAPLVARGGALVYSVCSLEPEEGIDQIRDFLVRHPEFAPSDPQQVLGPCVDGLVAGDPPLLCTRPDRDGSDGFVAARLVRSVA